MPAKRPPVARICAANLGAYRVAVWLMNGRYSITRSIPGELKPVEIVTQASGAMAREIIMERFHALTRGVSIHYDG